MQVEERKKERAEKLKEEQRYLVEVNQREEAEKAKHDIKVDARKQLMRQTAAAHMDQMKKDVVVLDSVTQD